MTRFSRKIIPHKFVKGFWIWPLHDLMRFLRKYLNLKSKTALSNGTFIFAMDDFSGWGQVFQSFAKVVPIPKNYLPGLNFSFYLVYLYWLLQSNQYQFLDIPNKLVERIERVGLDICSMYFQVSVYYFLFKPKYGMRLFCSCCDPEIVLKIKQNNFRFATRTKHENRQTIKHHIMP